MNIAGTKYITKKGTQAQRMSSSSQGCFTVLPFLAATGKAVCCVVIFQSQLPSPNFEWAHGIDIKKQQNRKELGEVNPSQNFGPGEYYLCGPTCE